MQLGWFPGSQINTLLSARLACVTLREVPVGGFSGRVNVGFLSERDFAA